MAEFPEFTVSDFANYLYEDEDNLDAYIELILEQSVLFVQEVTGVDEWPDSTRLQKLFTFAIYEVANRFYNERKYESVINNPMQSETIGSYSYSKSTTAQSILSGRRPTGLVWLDMLLSALSKQSKGSEISGGSTSVFEHDGVYEVGGQRFVPGPAFDPRRHRYPGPYSPYPAPPIEE